MTPTPLVVFPDVEELLVGHLTLELATYWPDEVKVATKVPAERPNPFVLVGRQGGTRLDIVTDAAQVGFEVWDTDEDVAQDLAQVTRAIVHGIRGQVVDGVTFYRIEEFAGVQRLPDPLSGDPRYVFAESIHVRGEELLPVEGS